MAAIIDGCQLHAGCDRHNARRKAHTEKPARTLVLNFLILFLLRILFRYQPRQSVG